MALSCYKVITGMMSKDILSELDSMNRPSKCNNNGICRTVASLFFHAKAFKPAGLEFVWCLGITLEDSEG